MVLNFIREAVRRNNDNNKCVPDQWRYDYDNDCGDNSDEKDCPSTTCEAGSQFRCDWAVYQQQVEM